MHPMAYGIKVLVWNYRETEFKQEGLTNLMIQLTLGNPYNSEHG